MKLGQFPSLETVKLEGQKSISKPAFSLERTKYALALLAALDLTACHSISRPTSPTQQEAISAPDYLSLNGHPLLETLRERGVFDEKEKWHITASSQAFQALGAQLDSNPESADLLKKSELNILCPASGILLSPFDLVFSMLNRPNNLQKVNLTYTEISPDAYENIDQHLQKLAHSLGNITNFQVTEELLGQSRGEDQPKLKKISFDFRNSTGKNVRINLDFEYKMSGEQYFRPSSGAEADLTIFHDIGDENGYGADQHAAYQAISSYEPSLQNKPHFFVMDYSSIRGINYNGIGQVIFQNQDVNYGCGENHLASDPTRMPSKGISLIKLDTALLENLRQWKGQTALDAYAHLVSGKATIGIEPNILDDKATTALALIKNFHDGLPASADQKKISKVIKKFIIGNEELLRSQGDQATLKIIDTFAPREHVMEVK